MASAADHAEQRVHDQRRLIEQKLTRLETRVRDDLSTAQAATRERTSDVTQSIPGRYQIERQVEQRPLTSLATALAAGIGLGMISESVSVRGNGQSSTGRDEYERPMGDGSRGGRSGVMSWLAGPATVAILGPVQSQIQEFVSAALAGLSNGGAQQPAAADAPEGRLPGIPVPPRGHTSPSEPPPVPGR